MKDILAQKGAVQVTQTLGIIHFRLQLLLLKLRQVDIVSFLIILDHSFMFVLKDSEPFSINLFN